MTCAEPFFEPLQFSDLLVIKTHIRSVAAVSAAKDESKITSQGNPRDSSSNRNSLGTSFRKHGQGFAKGCLTERIERAT